MEFSAELNEIFGALAEFRNEVTQPKKDASNPQFRSKYVDLDNVTHVIDKVAPKFGLAYIQNVKSNDETVSVQTIITHKSGQYIAFDSLTLDARPFVKGGGVGRVTAHSTGSAITYGRRYTLSSAFGIASEVDDDGNAASGSEQVPQNKPKEPKQPTFHEWVNNQYTEINKLTGWEIDKINEALVAKAGQPLKGLEQSQVVAVINESIAEIKKLNAKKQEQQGGNWYE